MRRGVGTQVPKLKDGCKTAAHHNENACDIFWLDEVQECTGGMKTRSDGGFKCQRKCRSEG